MIGEKDKNAAGDEADRQRERQPSSSPDEQRAMDAGGANGNQHSGETVRKSYPTFWMRCPSQLRCHPFCVHEGLWGSNRRKKVRG